jgi:hypothetical protein
MMENCLITTNTILYCKEWEKTVEFYRNQLKLPVLFATDWFVEFGLNEMSRLSSRRKTIIHQRLRGQGRHYHLGSR